MRRRVRWLSLTFLDFVLLVFSGCGLTCAAHIAGANRSPPTITTRRRQRVPDSNILVSFPRIPGFPYSLNRCPKRTSLPVLTVTSANFVILRELQRSRQ